MSAHLDLRSTAKGNSLVRQLRARGVEPEECAYQLCAIGPLFDEEQSMPSHKPIRDEVGTIECCLAKHLRDRGYDVLGTHHQSGVLNEVLFDQVCEVMDTQFQSILT